MNCKKAQSLMLDSLYRELPPRKKNALERHLHRCLSCSEEFANQKATVSTFQSVDFENPPSDLSEIVKEMAVKELEQEALLSRRKRSVGIWRPALASIAAAVLVTIGIIYYLPQAQMRKQIQEIPPQADHALSSTSETADTMDEDVSPPIGAKEQVENAFPAQLASGETASVLYRKLQEQPGSPAPAANENVGEEAQTAEPATWPSSLKKQNYAANAFHEDRRLLLENKEKGVPEKEAQGSLHLKSRSADTETEAIPEENLVGGAPVLDQKSGELAAGIATPKQGGDLTEGRGAVDARFRLGQAYQEANEFERAISVYLYIEEHYPDYPSLGKVYLAAADCYLALGRSAEALKSYEFVRDRFPELRDEARDKIFSVLAQEPQDTAVSEEDK